MDFDEICGFWLYNRPYVWIQGPTIETSRRLYLVYNKDNIYIWTRPGYKSGLGPFEMGDRRILFSKFRYFKSSKGPEYGKISMIDLWDSKDRKEMCSWAANYFGVYIRKRDGNLKDLDVRKNGIPFKPKGPPNLVNYLKKAKKRIRYPDFIKKPEWLSDRIE